MAGVRGRGPAGAAEFMGRRRPPVGPRHFGAPNRHRQGCALCRDPSAVERRAPRATTHGPRTRVARLAYGTDAVTRTGRMTGRHPMLAETLDASVIFHGCGRHNHDPTAASACGDGLKIVWTSEVASAAPYTIFAYRLGTYLQVAGPIFRAVYPARLPRSWPLAFLLRAVGNPLRAINHSEISWHREE